MTGEKNMDIEITEIPAGTVLKLSAQDMDACVAAIKEYDPNMADVVKVIRSNGYHLVDIHLSDGAVWQMDEHPIGLIPILRQLGSENKGKPLTVNVACAYCPEQKTTKSNVIIVVPEVECQEGYRQLDFDEEILATDEYYAGPKAGWKKTGAAGEQYRPRHCDASYGPYALMRRQLKKNRVI